MKITKDQARQQVSVYGDLLRERAVISDITQEERRGNIIYKFTILDTKYPLNFECSNIKDLGSVLSALWTTYLKVYNEVGLPLYFNSI